MDSRKQVGLIFTYNENWIGGTYYILNLVQALNRLEDKDKPVLHVISDKRDSYDYLVGQTAYPYTKFISHSFSNLFFWKTCSTVLSKLFKKRVLFRQIYAPAIDFYFPVIEPFWLQKESEDKKIYWIPDFQENTLPEFFPAEEVIERKTRQVMIALKSRRLVLSSKSSAREFRQLYPFSGTNVHVVPFAVSHPDFKGADLTRFKDAFGGGPYFYCPNQFWAHKNHRVVIDALDMLHRRGIEKKVLFSGKEFDHRNTGLADELKRLVKEKGLERHVFFLGFLDRKDQLQLMSEAEAVIQPSLCEGWSTVVEDAKALNKFVIASALDVHKEQLEAGALFFDPHSADELAGILAGKDFVLDGREDYSFKVREFGQQFVSLMGQ